MKCPECVERGERSVVTYEGAAINLLWSPPRWDEDGKLLPSKPAGGTYGYSCSQGHRWTKKV